MITKIQYNYYEDGEYTDIQYLDLSEILHLFNTFPFSDSSKHKSFVYSAEDSICLENTNNQFLKIVKYHPDYYHLLYFNSKDFSLHQKLVQQSNDVIDIISNFYESALFNPSHYCFDTPSFQEKLLESFKGKSFEYSTRKRWKSYLFKDNILDLIYLICGLSLLFWGLLTHKSIFPSLILLPLGIISCTLFLNYYLKSKDYVLILSKGSSTFQYGPKAALQTFEKSNIKSFEEIGIKNIRAPFNQYYYVKITMKDNTVVIIPNIIISDSDLQLKFPRLNGSTRKQMPYIFEKSLIS